jgi:NAD(P)-dependent dehydrogenase (short-subunit alcohol dehydrogenase family)
MKSVFITGAASGIGLASARRFAAEGWFVGLYDIDEARVGDILQEPAFRHACGSGCDVRARDSVRRALQEFASHTDGRIDVLINNAGVLAAGRFEEIDAQATDAMIAVNVQGLTNVAGEAFSWLRQTPGSVLVNLCSVSSIHGVPLLAVYSASKFYVDGLSQALSIEWAQHGIRVIAVKPPFVSTTMIEGMPAQLMKTFTVDFAPEDVAEAIIAVLENPGDSLLLDLKSKALNFLSRIIPARARRRLTMWLTGF